VATIYRYLNDMSNRVEMIEIQNEYIMNEIENNLVIIPTNTDIIETNEIIVTIGNELILRYASLRSILIFDENDVQLVKDDIEEITSDFKLEPSLSTKKLEDVIDDSEGHVHSFVNPMIIHVKFKEIKKIKAIKIIMDDHVNYIDNEPDLTNAAVRVAYNNYIGLLRERMDTAIYQCMKVQYINQSAEMGEDLLGLKLLVESCANGWHPDSKVYDVDFSYIKGRKYLIKENDNLVLTYRDVDSILQDYIKKEELDYLFNKSYERFVKDVADTVVQILIGSGRKY